MIFVAALSPSYPENVVACHTTVPVLPLTTAVEVMRVGFVGIGLGRASTCDVFGGTSFCAAGVGDRIITAADENCAKASRTARVKSPRILELYGFVSDWGRTSEKMYKVCRRCRAGKEQ